MKNPWIRYTLIRLALFFGIFFIFAVLEFNIYFAAIIAAAISFAISLLVLDRERRSLSEQIHQKLARDESGIYSDAESDLENDLLDQIEGEKGPSASEGEADNGQPEAHK